jgi:hypothetical protein
MVWTKGNKPWNSGLTKETDSTIANISAIKTEWHATHDTSGNNNPCAKQIDEKQLIDLYVNQKKSAEDCGLIIGLSSTATANRLQKLGIYRSQEEVYKILYNLTEIDDTKLIDLYVNQQKSLQQCGDVFGTSKKRIQRRLIKLGVTRRSATDCRIGRHTTIHVDIPTLLKLYNTDKLTIKDCAKHFNCTSPSIRKLLHESNIVTRPNKGDSHYNKGQTVPDSTRSKISLTLGGTGTPYEGTYDRNVFTEELKDQIRLRDHNQCQLCCKLQQESLDDIGRKLDVHHIDYDKSNCHSSNLIALCIDCHSPTNVNREYWKARLQKYQTERNII